MAGGATSAVSVVVPVYNGVSTVEELVHRLTDVLAGGDYEILLVNDGSEDASWNRIVELATADEHVRGLDLMRNYGQHNALLAGVRAVRHDVTVTLDDDLQNPPEEIPKLLAKLSEGYDVVYGSADEPAFGFLRRLATRMTKWALRVAIGDDVASKVSAFRAFRTDLREAFAGFQGSDVSLDVLLSWGARRFGWIAVEHHAREQGRSSYGFGRLAKHALNVLTGFTTRPLRVATLVGLLFTLFGVVILALVVFRYFTEDAPPGFPFLASLIAIFSGVQLLTLGVIGEYLARMHLRIMDRPSYAVREEVSRSSVRYAVREEVGAAEE